MSDTRNADSSAGTAHYREMVRRMMYSNGDLEEPLPPCVDMVLDLAKFQMVKALQDAWEQANAQGRSCITLEDVLALFRRHKFLLKRLLQFAEAAERISLLKQAAPRPAKLDEDLDQDSDVDDDDLATASVPDSSFSRMQKYVDTMGLGESAAELMQLPDREFEERQRRVAEIVMNGITSEEYPRYTAARTATFLDETKRAGRRKNDSVDLLRWLGAPKCEPSVAFVIAFIGREVVAYYVDAAYTVMKTEESNLFLNEVRVGHVAADDEDCPLQLRHYEEALRRCVGWRRHRDFLFGFYEESNETVPDNKLKNGSEITEA